ncbi:MAG: FAD-dependent oxidoreductase [Alphaproteobacteria bacterium]|nr:FAD-dependent oxidoreductase [Alphaproteobacteria bacterium]
MPECWDVVVIGAGPAGLTAAQVAGASGLSCLCIDRLGPGGELINLGLLHDCPDLPPDTTGADLVTRLMDAATAAGVELAFGEVRELQRGEPRRIVTDDETYQARTVIVATGLTPGRLGVPEEERFDGVGLSHCASCDGPLYKGENVVVAGAGEWAAQEALDLAALAGHVTLICPEHEAARLSSGRGRQLAGLTNVTVIPGRIASLEGAEGLEAVVIERAAIQERHPTRAVFVQSNRRAALDFTRGLLAVEADGRACVDGDLCTSDEQAYAAGDVRAGAPERIASAIADGRRAGLAVARLLRGRDGEQQGGR